MIWFMNGINKLSIIMTLLTLLSIISFFWIAFWSYDTKSLKLNVMMDMKVSNHLITAVLNRIEKKEFEQLEYEAYDLNRHCYECLIV